MPASPLDHIHRELGARFVDFGGWSMPVQYEGVLAEHQAVRSSTGVFDVSHLGRVQVSGPGATELLGSIFCNNIRKAGPGGAQYTMLLTPRGGVVDDIIVWRLGEEDYIVMPNGVNVDDVEGVLKAAAPPDVDIVSRREDTALLAVQGPGAPDLIEAVVGWKPKRFGVAQASFGGEPLSVAGTGYTGEPGGELMVSQAVAGDCLRGLLDAGAIPCGLGSRDTLRLEMGYPLWGQDLDEDTSPLEAGLEWVVDWDHDFIGRKSLLRQKSKGVAKTQVGFVMKGRQIPRAGYALRAGPSTGAVTSGNFSPVLDVGIGLGYLAPPPVFHRFSRAEGDPEPALEVEIRGEWLPVTLKSPPFIKGD